MSTKRLHPEIADVNGRSLRVGGVVVTCSGGEDPTAAMDVCRRIFQFFEVESRSCVYCEHFDGGGLRRVERARKTGEQLHGDCLNRSSPRFQTFSGQTCELFFSDSVDADENSE